MTDTDWKEMVDLMFALEEVDRESATRLTMTAIHKASWPYSQSGLGFGPLEEATDAMRRHAPVLLRDLRKLMPATEQTNQEQVVR